MRSIRSNCQQTGRDYECRLQDFRTRLHEYTALINQLQRDHSVPSLSLLYCRHDEMGIRFLGKEIAVRPHYEVHTDGGRFTIRSYHVNADGPTPVLLRTVDLNDSHGARSAPLDLEDEFFALIGSSSTVPGPEDSPELQRSLSEAFW